MLDPIYITFLIVAETGSFSKQNDYKSIVENSKDIVKLKIIGIVKYKETPEKGDFNKKFKKMFSKLHPIKRAICYSKELGDYIYETTKNSEIVKEQQKNTSSVLQKDDNDRFYVDVRDSYLTDKEKIERNLEKIGYSKNAESISIYMKDPVKYKDKIVGHLKDYNEGKSQEDQVEFAGESDGENIAYTLRQVCVFLIFTIGLASLIVSLIMVGILEFVSVLERTREIGILRSIGARKKDVANLFKSEALIIGLFTGVAGVAIAELLSFPINSLIKRMFHIDSIHLVQIDIKIFVGLTLFSLFVTLLAGLIPAKIASRKDPVKILTGSNN